MVGLLSAGLYEPAALAVDGQAVLYVAGQGNPCVYGVGLRRKVTGMVVGRRIAQYTSVQWRGQTGQGSGPG
ncbi:MAG: hypothetical protein NNA18_01430 [Nitrospira sp.]|nr:hypothetical protein [Nitrospira sp.]